MDRFAGVTGRRYRLFDYVGAADAERVLVLMGSGRRGRRGDRRGAAERAARRSASLKVRLYRPFSVEHFLAALPPTVRTLAVLDRTKEPGAIGEPLYLDVVAALHESAGVNRPRVDRRPLRAVLQGVHARRWSRPSSTSAAATGRSNHFTVGIRDDVTHTSLDFDPAFSTEDPDTVRAVFYGLGSDGTVGANKNSIKIIGEETDHYAQGYFVYDSKKSGSVTVSHLRFGPRPIRSTYLISRANFVACHQFSLPRPHRRAATRPSRGRRSCSTAPTAPDEVWDHLPRAVQETDHRQEAAVLRHRRLPAWPTRRAWAAASTPSCRPASSR